MNPSTRTERRRQRLEDPRLDWARRTPVRRRLVVGMVALIAAEGVALGFAFTRPPVAPGIGPLLLGITSLVVIVVAAAWVFCLGALKASVRGIEELGRDGLDERQWQLRGDIYARAYRIGRWLLAVLLAAAAAWGIYGDGVPPAAVVAPAILVTFHVALVLPTLVAAWHERV